MEQLYKHSSHVVKVLLSNITRLMHVIVYAVLALYIISIVPNYFGFIAYFVLLSCEIRNIINGDKKK